MPTKNFTERSLLLPLALEVVGAQWAKNGKFSVMKIKKLQALHDFSQRLKSTDWFFWKKFLHSSGTLQKKEVNS